MLRRIRIFFRSSIFYFNCAVNVSTALVHLWPLSASFSYRDLEAYFKSLNSSPHEIIIVSCVGVNLFYPLGKGVGSLERGGEGEVNEA